MATLPGVGRVRSCAMSARWRLLLTLVAIGLAVFIVVDRPVNYGLDLEGGTQVVLDLKPRPGEQLATDAADRTLEILRRRVDSLGVAEPNLSTSGQDRILVELPGVTDPDEAVRVIGSTARLSFHRVQGEVAAAPTPPPAISPDAATPTAPANASTPAPPGTPVVTSAPAPPTTAAGFGATTDERETTVLGQADPSANTPAPANPVAPADPAPGAAAPAADGPLIVPDDAGRRLQLAPAALTGDGVDDARANPPDQGNLTWYLSVDFDGPGSSAWTKLTGEAACASSPDPTRRVAIVLDNRVISSPEVNPEVQCNVGITGNTTVINGQFSREEAQNLALLIRGGALPVDVAVASQRVIGPELGDEAIDDSRKAVAIGGLLTLLFILFYYRGLGLLAAISLISYGLISFAVLLGLGLTLTLPGIAGFVLAIGTAMDSNILVFERVKEEYAAGRPLRTAGRLGFQNALSAILDSNATTLLAATVLFFLAVGEVRGFGVTLMVGVITSVLVTLVITRTLVEGLLRLGWASKHPRLLGLTVGSRFRDRLSANPPNLMRLAKWFLVASVIVVLLALAGVFTRGVNYGIEFSGGRLIEYSSDRAVDVDQARDEIRALGFDEAVVQRTGTDDLSIRLESLTPEQLTAVQGIVERLGGPSTKLQDETIGPSFGDELRRRAIIGLILGVALQLAFMAWRFRWTFGVGAVVGMIHDVLLVVGVFAWLGKPFDAVFLASLLTVIAYSINDSVVVFDRIREQRRRRTGATFVDVVNDSCAQTIPRTINTGLSAVFILTALLFLGGQTLGDFSLALLIGIITGIYSSVFVASPVAVALERWRPSLSKGMPTGTRRGLGDGGTGARSAGRSAALGTGVVVDEADGDAGGSASVSGGNRPTANRPPPRPRKKSSQKKKR